MHSTIHGWLTITLCILALQHCCDWNFDKELNLIVTTLYSNIWSAMNITLGHNSWSYRSKLSDWHTQIRCQVSSFPLYLVYSGWSRHVVINVPTTAGLHCCHRYGFHWSTDLTPSCFATAIWPLLLNTSQWFLVSWWYVQSLWCSFLPQPSHVTAVQRNMPLYLGVISAQHDQLAFALLWILHKPRYLALLKHTLTNSGCHTDIFWCSPK